MVHSLDLEVLLNCMRLSWNWLFNWHNGMLQLYTGEWIPWPQQKPLLTCCQELRYRDCMSHLLSMLVISDVHVLVLIPTSPPFPVRRNSVSEHKLFLTSFIRTASTCQNKCGVNTWCTGNWATPASLTCSCFDGFSSPTNDGKACTCMKPYCALIH